MLKATILLVSGLDAKPNDNWFPWFKEELSKMDYQVLIPDLSVCGLKRGRIFFELVKNLFKIRSRKLILVGHSLGAVIALKLAESILKLRFLPLKIQKLILVAPAGRSNANWEAVEKRFGSKLISLAKKAFDKVDFDWELFCDKVKERVVYVSKDDPYLDFQRTLVDYELFRARKRVFEDKGHFSDFSGVNRLPEIREEF